MPVRAQSSDRTKLNVHDCVKTRFKIKNSYWASLEVHNSRGAESYKAK